MPKPRALQAVPPAKRRSKKAWLVIGILSLVAAFFVCATIAAFVVTPQVEVLRKFEGWKGGYAVVTITVKNVGWGAVGSVEVYDGVDDHTPGFRMGTQSEPMWAEVVDLAQNPDIAARFTGMKVYKWVGGQVWPHWTSIAGANTFKITYYLDITPGETALLNSVYVRINGILFGSSEAKSPMLQITSA